MHVDLQDGPERTLQTNLKMRYNPQIKRENTPSVWCPNYWRGTQQITLIIDTPRQKSIRALEIFRVQKLILNATS